MSQQTPEALGPERQWALEQFAALADRLGSQSKACAEIGISQAIMSTLKKGAYPGDVNAQFERLLGYFRARQEARAAAGRDGGGYVPTSISTRVREVIRMAHLKGGLAVACGDAGIGKSRAAAKYAADHPGEALYMVLNPCVTNLKSCLRMLSNRLGVTERTVDEMWLAIAGKLRDGMVLIFDEAQHLPIKTVEALRSLSDHADGEGKTLGVVFIGNSETVARFGGRKKAEFAQIANRTRQRKVYQTADVRREDIELLFPALAGKEKEIDLLWSVARSLQGVRGACNLYANAYDNEDTSYSGLVAMAKHMEMRV